MTTLPTSTTTRRLRTWVTLAFAYIYLAWGVTYMAVQRHVPTQWQQYANVPDVYLTPVDPHATDITFPTSTWQSAAGSTITDSADENGLDGGPPPSPTLPD